MKRLFLLLSVLLFVGCQETIPNYPDGAKVFKVTGMGCSGCETTVKQAVWHVGDVTWVTADRKREEVAYTGTAPDLKVVEAIEASGHHYEGQYKVIGRSPEDWDFKGN